MVSRYCIEAIFQERLVAPIQTPLKKLFASKQQMRRELSAKQVVYNSFTMFAKEMKLPFGKAKHLWKYLAVENQKLFTSLAGKVTILGKKASRDLKKTR